MTFKARTKYGGVFRVLTVTADDQQDLRAKLEASRPGIEIITIVDVPAKDPPAQPE